MRMKRTRGIFWCLLLLCLLGLLLAACDGRDRTDGETSGDTTQGVTDGETPPTLLPIVAEGRAVRVVIATNAPADLRKSAENVVSRIEKLTGVKPQLKEVFANEENSSEDIEILIGDVGYPESDAVRARIGYDECCAAVEGNKIVVTGFYSEKLGRSINQMLSQFNECLSEDGKSILIPSDWSASSSAVSLAKQIPICKDVTASRLLQSSPGVYELLFYGFDSTNASDYAKTVTDAGWAVYAENRIDNNHYITYTKGNYALTTMWIGNKLQLRVVIEEHKVTSLPQPESANVYQKGVCSTLFTQVGLNYRQGALEGICDIMRLEDGSFIIIDGGHGYSENGERIYKILREQAPDPERIVIAAWVLSHGHSDHIGFFKEFAERYGSRVKVETFLYNIPTEEICSPLEDGGLWTKAETAIGGYFGDSAVVRAHPGQVLYLRNAKLTVLYTHELITSTAEAFEWYNSTSLVFTIEAEGVKTFLPTDAGLDIGKLMASIYSDATFASDVMQIAHHGIVNTSHILYPKINPTYVLWPMGTGDISRRKDENGNYTSADCAIYLHKDFNAFVWNSEKCRDNVFVANDDVYVLQYRDGAVRVSFYENDAAYYASNQD